MRVILGDPSATDPGAAKARALDPGTADSGTLDPVSREPEHATPLIPTKRPPGRHRHDRAGTVFRIWIVVYGVVGAQMGWILRPFIGTPDAPFQLLRERDSHFFEAVLNTLRKVLGG